VEKTIAAIFNSYSYAENAAKQVKDYGLRTDDISIVAKENENNKGVTDNISGGATTGGVLGGLAGLLLGIGTVVIPGLGVIAAAGPIAGILSGAITGGIVGGLVDLGIPEEAGKRYEQDVKQGKVLWTMSTEEGSVDRISDILKSNGAENVEVH
jgi:uncharacterized membrane protein